MDGHCNSEEVGVSKAKILKGWGPSSNLKKPYVDGAWIFTGTTRLGKTGTDDNFALFHRLGKSLISMCQSTFANIKQIQ